MWVRKQQYPCQPICLVPKRRQKAICLPSPQIYTYPCQRSPPGGRRGWHHRRGPHAEDPPLVPVGLVHNALSSLVRILLVSTPIPSLLNLPSTSSSRRARISGSVSAGSGSAGRCSSSVSRSRSRHGGPGMGGPDPCQPVGFVVDRDADGLHILSTHLLSWVVVVFSLSRRLRYFNFDASSRLMRPRLFNNPLTLLLNNTYC